MTMKRTDTKLTIKRLAGEFCEESPYGLNKTDMLCSCASWPVVAYVDGKLRRAERVTFTKRAMVLIVSKTEYRGPRRKGVEDA